MMDLRTIGVFRNPHLLILGERNVLAGLDAGDEAGIHAIAEFGDAVGEALEMPGPEEAGELRPVRSPWRFDLLDAQAEIGFESVGRLAHQCGNLRVDARMTEIGTE